MKQPIEEIEKHYEKPDPWGYQTHPQDAARAIRILTAIAFMPSWDDRDIYKTALDLGAGEGWITQSLPALEIHGYEISALARSRMPKKVKPISRVEELLPSYDLIVATGVLYSHYDWELFHQIIRERTTRIVVSCNIKDWEIPVTGLNQIYEEEFPYREYIQKLRVFRV